jgi:hypothetical protein
MAGKGKEYISGKKARELAEEILFGYDNPVEEVQSLGRNILEHHIPDSELTAKIYALCLITGMIPNFLLNKENHILNPEDATSRKSNQEKLLAFFVQNQELSGPLTIAFITDLVKHRRQTEPKSSASTK